MLKRIFLLAVLTIILVGCARKEEVSLDCGAVVTSDVILTRDLKCKGHGIRVEADNVVVDLGGYTITGPGKGEWVWPGRALYSVGIEVSGRKGVKVRNGRIRNFATGVLLEYTNAVTVEGVSTSDNHYGIYLYMSNNNQVVQNEIDSNVYGLTLLTSNENLLKANTIARSHYSSPGGYGICLYESSDNTIMENTVSFNIEQGIWLINANGNLIYRNNLLDNHPNAAEQSSAGSWYNASLKEGNYWSDYRGSDADGDGIGEVPYVISETGSRDLSPFVNRDGWRRTGGASK